MGNYIKNGRINYLNNKRKTYPKYKDGSINGMDFSNMFSSIGLSSMDPSSLITGATNIGFNQLNKGKNELISNSGTDPFFQKRKATVDTLSGAAAKIGGPIGVGVSAGLQVFDEIATASTDIEETVDPTTGQTYYTDTGKGQVGKTIGTLGGLTNLLAGDFKGFIQNTPIGALFGGRKRKREAERRINKLEDQISTKQTLMAEEKSGMQNLMRKQNEDNQTIIGSPNQSQFMYARKGGRFKI